ncbi:peptide-methionine (S)-S-oxide reductase MsrA [Azoarcus communis]|uniref:Peptide methionine sulfoxide reductase MsrA n=1 Tax=Parazoarcus communis SWub3 = DSM 12120 TaxID=1121029 RepID=A0A323V1Q2_9RHOO|nr:peptide-methionine (S)-S-oxide reductase MsrA [Parazoarcus communis]NMG49394.1 peptide-methionine (S)-S-oxide reductase MsrA [Parazoarcus communis]NMG69472.1 peptide-methionine (S)-S-oxide reductase MsrA [Parazoarcus communis SWub3 = DSM 12120]PZA17416.1 peptide-methionine (S)-S-oxide reductase [Azoarcus communis] [Parazoarcus communis SWub3 = DSM 12120]
MNDSVERPKLETAVLGGGCFWCLEAVFREVEGVHSVTSGYAGGHVEHPAYRQVCEGSTGHAEVVRVEFDPAVLSYRDLLEIFFVIHDPTTLNRQGNDIGTQYRSVIFVSGDEQLHTALALIEELGEARIYPHAIVTRVERDAPFWPAEPEHHDYYTNHSDQPYCQYVVAPKVSKFREKFAGRRRRAS